MTELTRENMEVHQVIRLVASIQRVQDNLLDQYARVNWGLTSGQLRLLLALVPGRPVSGRELARRLFTDPANVSGLLRRLAGKGLISMHESPTDRRVQLVSLTPSGEEIQAEHWKRRQGELASYEYLRSLPAEERSELLQSLLRYATHLIGRERVEELLDAVEEEVRHHGPDTHESARRVRVGPES